MNLKQTLHTDNYSDYNEAFHPTKIEVDNLHSDIECDDIDVDISSERDETCKWKRGPYIYYSEVQKQIFWKLVIEQGNSAYKAAQPIVRFVKFSIFSVEI
ncbi:hypothetical protein CANMA_003173 [Candida margitis]|uniref:uncharacterized protein n=1 Tax=Candida margitis TaxID=1775924 RepID=UPI002226E3D7|nr:uncharacterized protein CANMA_003173 [Candida margitis]KAI5967353.1 hypothetical protein CANMA_003173 [Candida margitis]